MLLLRTTGFLDDCIPQLLLWGTSQSKVALANARDLSGSRERMPKSTLSLPKCCCLFITVAGHFNQCPTVSGS